MNKKGLIVAGLVAIICLAIWNAMNGLNTGVLFELMLRQQGLGVAIQQVVANNIPYAIATGLATYGAYKIATKEKGISD
jgi:hypothetical protein